MFAETHSSGLDAALGVRVLQRVQGQLCNDILHWKELHGTVNCVTYDTQRSRKPDRCELLLLLAPSAPCN